MSNILDFVQGIIGGIFMMFLLVAMIIFVYLTPAIILITDFVFRYKKKKHLIIEVFSFVMEALLIIAYYEMWYVNIYYPVTLSSMSGIAGWERSRFLFDYDYSFFFVTFVMVGFISYIILKYCRNNVSQNGFRTKQMNKITQGFLLGGIYPGIVITVTYMGYLISMLESHIDWERFSLDDFITLPLYILADVKIVMQVISVWFLISVGRLFWKMKKEGTSGKIFLLGVGIALILIAVILGIGMLFGQEPDSLFLFFWPSGN